MKQYQTLLKRALNKGVYQSDRTGVGVRALFGQSIHFSLTETFPLVTTKKIHFKSVVEELLWFLRGETNVRSLQEKNVSIWDEWADEQGNLGRIYGAQWRSWIAPNGEHIDQIANLLKGLRENPHSRRHVLSAWNVGELDQMALPPCHCLVQFCIIHEQLQCCVFMRSCDIFLGLPFNIASYALLTRIFASFLSIQRGKLQFFIGHAHLYENHLEQAKVQLSREPRPLPRLLLDPEVQSFEALTAKAIRIIGYEPYPAIPAPIAV